MENIEDDRSAGGADMLNRPSPCLAPFVTYQQVAIICWQDRHTWAVSPVCTTLVSHEFDGGCSLYYKKKIHSMDMAIITQR